LWSDGSLCLKILRGRRRSRQVPWQKNIPIWTFSVRGPSNGHPQCHFDDVVIRLSSALLYTWVKWSHYFYHYANYFLRTSLPVIVKFIHTTLDHLMISNYPALIFLLGVRCVKFKASLLWNNLPTKLKGIKNLSIFKNIWPIFFYLKMHLTKRQIIAIYHLTVSYIYINIHSNVVVSRFVPLIWFNWYLMFFFLFKVASSMSVLPFLAVCHACVLMLYCIVTVVCYVSLFEWQIKFSLSLSLSVMTPCYGNKNIVIREVLHS